MDEDEWYARHGLHPADPEPVRELLRQQTALGPSNDSLLIHLAATQLFLRGDLADVLLIWRAERSSFDAGCSVEWQLLCGAGRERTLDHLRTLGTAEADEVLAYLAECDPEDVADFDVAERSRWYEHYYAGA
ncbi:hypothetical protein [Micromonospora auratinigra]|uniref:Uncharacterized protein n=1 Tax=Micromonospora auratinigra TaxID=261654 RepID=A0A1A9A8B4_9ACTN|nr:hypothetical protein [Micromonospora auratinigra]SBT52452.1 hypothetical protein GA0070611_5643 [Micromonospora auratinigra]